MNKNPWSRQKNFYTSPQAVQVERSPKRRWLILPILWKALVRTCTALGAMILISVVYVMWLVGPALENIETGLPEEMVLYMELDGNLSDLPSEISLVDPFSKQKRTLKSYIDAIERAKTDPRVKGIYANAVSATYPVAYIQELREAIIDFRTSGKFAYIYAPSYDGGLGSYYLASGFDEIWMQPIGVVMINGISAEMPFFREVMDKIGVEPNFFQRKEYKSAYESFTNSKISEANRESTQALIDDIAGTISADISKDRNIDFNSLVDRGLFIAQEAEKAGLVDHVNYADELVDHINTLVTGEDDSMGVAYVQFDRYVNDMAKVNKSMFAKKKDDNSSSKPQVALIYAMGAIVDEDDKGAGVDDGVAGADEIAGALLDVAEDESIKAVVLRVNSPGGSPVASETILRAIHKVQEAGKTVTVSMGPVAASGGYWISASADQIFVLPTTITGSIGVLGGKFSAEKLWEQVGVNWGRVQWGKNSGMWSMNTPFSKAEAERMNVMLDNIYDGFISRVAEGRGMDKQAVEKIARGRVWSGVQAVKIGLADQFGGLNAALDYAAVKAGASDRRQVDVVIMPKPLSAFEQFVELLEVQATSGKTLGKILSHLKPLEALIDDAMIMHDAKTNSVYAPINVP